MCSKHNLYFLLSVRHLSCVKGTPFKDRLSMITEGTKRFGTMGFPQ
jgi:hypothetical protein